MSHPSSPENDDLMAFRSVLIMTYHFAPQGASGSFRLLGFVRHLSKFGWRAIVVAPPGLPWEPTDEELLAQVPAEAAIYHVPYPKGLLWKPLRKFAPLEVWWPFAWASIRRAIREQTPEAVLTSGPPHVVHTLGCWVRKRYDLPWIADFRDPWIAANWLLPPNLVPRKRDVRAEAAVMREADAIVANTPRARDALARACPQHAAKMVSITNGYDPECFESSPAPPLSGETVTITHTGTIYANRDPRPLLEAVRDLGPDTLPGHRTLRIHLMGDVMDNKQSLEDQISQWGLGGRVLISGQVPYLQAMREMVRADILLLLDSPGRRFGVPAKLYEYIGAGRPILALAEVDSDVEWVLRESGVPYRIASPQEPAAIRSALLELLHDLAMVEVNRAGKLITARFTREHLAGELAGLLDSCLEARTCGSSSPGSRSLAALEHD